VIDLARLISGFCAGLIDNSKFLDALFRAAELTTDSGASPSSKAKETNALLVLRTVANTLQEGTEIGDGGWIKDVSSHSTYFYGSLTFCTTRQIFGILGGAPYVKFTKGQRVALSTVLFK
jgi:phospholipase A-2-activating protein